MWLVLGRGRKRFKAHVDEIGREKVAECIKGELFGYFYFSQYTI